MIGLITLIVVFLFIAQQAGWLVVSWNVVGSVLLSIIGAYALIALLCFMAFIWFVWYVSRKGGLNE